MSQLAHGRPPVAKAQHVPTSVLADSKKRYVPSHVAHDAYVASLHAKYDPENTPEARATKRKERKERYFPVADAGDAPILCKGGGGDAPSQSKGVPLIERTARPHPCAGAADWLKSTMEAALVACLPAPSYSIEPMPLKPRPSVAKAAAAKQTDRLRPGARRPVQAPAAAPPPPPEASTSSTPVLDPMTAMVPFVAAPDAAPADPEPEVTDRPSPVATAPSTSEPGSAVALASAITSATSSATATAKRRELVPSPVVLLPSPPRAPDRPPDFDEGARLPLHLRGRLPAPPPEKRGPSYLGDYGQKTKPTYMPPAKRDLHASHLDARINARRIEAAEQEGGAMAWAVEGDAESKHLGEREQDVPRRQPHAGEEGKAIAARAILEQMEQLHAREPSAAAA